MSDLSSPRGRCIIVTYSSNCEVIRFVSTSFISVCARIDTDAKPVIALVNANSRREVGIRSKKVKIGPFVLISGHDYEFYEDDPGFAEAIDPIIENPKSKILTAMAHFSRIGTISLAINNGYNHELNIDKVVDGVKSSLVLPPNKITIFRSVGSSLYCLGTKIFHGRVHLIRVKDQNLESKARHNPREDQTLEEMVDSLDEDLKAHGYTIMYYLEEASIPFHSTNIRAKSHLITPK